MTPMGDQTKQDMEAETADAVKKALRHRRAGDDPKEQHQRFVASLVLAAVVAAAGIGLRVAGLLGEYSLLAVFFLAGVIVKGESVIGLVRAGKRNGNGHADG